MGQPTPPAEPTTGATPPATGTEPTGTTTPPATTPPAATATGEGLGEAGKKALEAEREARKALEKQLAALKPLEGLAAALGVKAGEGKTDSQQLADRIAEMEKRSAEAELRALRLEVAAEKGLTPQQAARLAGANRDELAADADALKALFPGAAAGSTGTPGTPAPDPSQGARGGVNDLEALLKAAIEKKDVREQVRLKTAIAAAKAK